MKKQVTLYDTTLRDGTQAEEISFAVEDKLRIAEKLDALGIDYIEAGWPGSNPRDMDFFKQYQKLRLKNAKIAAFGSTRKSGNTAAKDPNLKALLDANTPVVTIFGKSWDFHAKEALRISLNENLELINDSVAYLKKNVDEVIYDAEHFFDGFKANPEYALKTLKAAEEGGADWIVLCDTNGGAFPDEVTEITERMLEFLKVPVGVHVHNDGELGVANSLAAIQAGARQVHGTINGIGERCGNANLVSIIPNLQLKLNVPVVSSQQLKRLTEVSRFVDELANKTPNTQQAYVGNSAFAHKGGIHVNAVAKNPKTYEHIDPEIVGNRRRVLVSDLSGASNILYKAQEFSLDLDSKDPVVKKILAQIKELENQGYQFEGAEASFEVLMKKAMGKYRPSFQLLSFRVTDEMRLDQKNPFSEASLQIEVDGKIEHTVAQGSGPVNALDQALRKALERFYPQLKKVKLIDYKVRVLKSDQGTGSQVRVLIESSDGKEKWGTVGVSENIIQASWMALVDSIDYKLLKDFEKRK
ncbi:MAG: citramalate synthase [Deltaproteobacteria bacterium]|nr:citramalate synthase [Deltaproteobacteria bacterium]